MACFFAASLIAEVGTSFPREDAIVEAWKILEWKNITLYAKAEDFGPRQIQKLLSLSSKSEMTMTWRSLQELESQPTLDKMMGSFPIVQDSMTILMKEKSLLGSKLTETIRKVVTAHKHGRVLIVADSPQIKEALRKEINTTIGFFLLSANGNQESELKRAVVQGRSGRMVERTIRSSEDKRRSLSDGMGLRLEVGMLPYEPNLIVGDESGAASGMLVDMLEIVAKRSNFSINLVLHPTGDWGEPPRGENGTASEATGMLGRLRSINKYEEHILSSLDIFLYVCNDR